MAKRIKLEMTETEFNSLFEMVEDNASFLAGAEEDFVKSTTRKLRIVNRMLKRNKINYVAASAYSNTTFKQ